ncbi:DNA-binding response regulator [Aquimarina macrocephali]|uniref:DNA-binding response regulator n=1 Tax=Aquimarina macrocephali TaxID=666563 RepID=UPI0004666029|nr:response regulator [Aquimarina macrocephali]
MFKKVLISEDQQSISVGLQNTLKEFCIQEIETVNYCDNALLKLRSARQKNIPFDLLITDLSFKEDHKLRKISSGDELIKQVRKIQPDLKIVVFSVENRIGKIRELVDSQKINAYVSKGRQGTEDIVKAINAILQDKYYYSDDIMKLLRRSDNISEIKKTDTLILKLIAKGLTQQQISDYFNKHNLTSGSKRNIEFRLQKLKELFDAKTLPQLIGIAKDAGLI